MHDPHSRLALPAAIITPRLRVVDWCAGAHRVADRATGKVDKFKQKQGIYKENILRAIAIAIAIAVEGCTTRAEALKAIYISYILDHAVQAEQTA